MEGVVSRFVVDVGHDQDEAGHAHGQPGKIDDGVELLALEVPVGDLEGILQEDSAPVQGIEDGMDEGPDDLAPEPESRPEAAGRLDLPFVEFFDVAEETVVLAFADESPRRRRPHGLAPRRFPAVLFIGIPLAANWEMLIPSQKASWIFLALSISSTPSSVRR